MSRPACAVLAGGLGTRLAGAIPDDLPKPMASVAGRPFLEHLLAWLRRSGVTEIVLCTGHRAEAIRRRFGDGRAWGLEIRYSREDRPLGTAGALALAAPLLEGDPVLAANGDSLCEVDLEALLELHRARGAAVTLAAARVQRAGRFGSLVLGPDGAVREFAEKAQGGEGLVNAGVYALSRAALERIAGAGWSSLEREAFPALVGGGLYACPTEAPLLDIGVPADLERAQSLLAGREGLS